MKDGKLELVLFTTLEVEARAAVAAGIDGLIVDWEWRGKERRQQGADTEVNRDNLEDLVRMAGAGARRVFCRVDGAGPQLQEQVEDALRGGATDVLLPMVREPREVELLLGLVAGRARVGILVETSEALGCLDDLAVLPLAWVYVGLNDLAICRGSGSIFEALTDGTVDRVREAFGAVRFGVAGVTAVQAGNPIPSRLLLAELARLEADFSFLRRSFKRDLEPAHYLQGVGEIRQAWSALVGRSAQEKQADRRALTAVVKRL